MCRGFNLKTTTMLKIFNKTKQAVKEMAEVFQEPKDPAVLVAEIHREFDEATDRLIDEHSSYMPIPDEGEALLNLGFTCNKKASEHQRYLGSQSYAKILAERVECFAVRYPSNKYITHEAVMSICSKYGLILGPADKFIGDIPKKNVDEMLAFKLKEEDFIEHICYELESHHFGKRYGYDTWDSFRGSGFKDVGDRSVSVVKEKASLMVCASKKDFIADRSKVAADGITLEMEDPIVLQPVGGDYGGYLIITKWGLEASDPSLTNETMN